MLAAALRDAAKSDGPHRADFLARAAALDVEADAYRRAIEETPDPLSGEASADLLGELLLYARLWLIAQFDTKKR